MYAEGGEEGVLEWVATVQRLRYKDFQCIRKPAAFEPALDSSITVDTHASGFEEVETVAAFASKIEQRGLLPWWRKAMGYMD